MFEQICQTLAYVHSQGIIHRDLKPANVMVGAFGEVQVMDWGLAKHISQQTSANAIQASKPEVPARELAHDSTQTGVAMGTIPYMAPEQARGEFDNLDERADVFGLGAILCVILTGKPAFYSLNRSDIVDMATRRDLGDAFARLDHCGTDVELISLCKQCLAPTKEDRPRDAATVAEAVEAYQDGVQEKLKRVEMRRARAEIEAREQRRRRRWIMTAALAGLLQVIGVAGGLLWYQHVSAARALEQAERRAEQTHRLASIKNAMQKNRDLRQQLHTQLTGEPGVVQMLNRPEEWRARIEAARSAWQLAKNLASESAEAIPAELRQQLAVLKTGLQQDQADFKLALKLERIRENKAVIVKNKFNYVGAIEDYRKAFAKVGLNVTGKQILKLPPTWNKSPIRKHLASALTD